MPNPSKIACYLAIDVGGQGCRCALFDAKGYKYHELQAHYPTYYPSPDRVEHHAGEILSAIEALLSAIKNHIEQENISINSCGLACQGATLLCWDKHTLEPLSPVLSWQDTRGKAIAEQASLNNDEWLHITGLHPSAHYGASKFSWCLKHISAVIEANEKHRLQMGPLANYLTQKLTSSQHAYCNPAHLARTQLWDHEKQFWNKKLLDRFSIPIEALPRPSPNRFDYGIIKGIDAPIILVNRDQSAALFSEGKPHKECAYINMGTGIFIQRPVASYSKRHTFGLQQSPCYSDSDGSLQAFEASIHSGLAVKKQLEDAIKQPLTSSLIEEALAEASSANKDRSWQLVTASGLGSPYWLENISSNLSSGTSIAATINSWLNSALYLVRQNLELIDNLLGPARQLIVSGGLSQYDQLCQRLADLSMRPVVRYKDTHATLRGTAYLTADQPESWQANKSNTFMPQSENSLEENYYQWLNGLFNYIPQQQTELIAVSHRGDINSAPENTINAIQLAIQSGIKHIEFDIQIDADGIPVLLHDPNLNRTHGINTTIFSSNSASISKLDNLWSLLDSLSSHNDLHLYIEIKHDSIDHWGIDRVLQAIAPLTTKSIRYTLLARSQTFLATARNLGHVSIGANVRRYDSAEQLNLLKLNPEYLVINHERIPENTKLWPGLWSWMVYEVENAAQARKLQQQGASYMISFNAQQLLCNEALHA
ncbi:FGGY family carbohydrate kinase [Maricurvus nonylphenolicus]|uniref:FGGY family carbohydrate kinase n=1 Tax=Maricurvus nonylphenolicus TaxID=1008307 RepID=UPI0036F266F4